MIFLLLLLACKGDTGTDSVPNIDSVDSVDSADTGEPFTCTPPTFEAVSAFEWGQNVTLGGYSLAVTSKRAWITAPYQGEYYGVPLTSGSGSIEELSDVKITVTPGGADKMIAYNGFFTVADGALGDDYEGAAYTMEAPTADSAVGVNTAASLAQGGITVTGENSMGFVGGGIFADVNLDGVDDFVTASGPIPSTIAIFNAAEDNLGSEYSYSDGIVIDACDESNLFATTSYAIFGMNDTYLAVGCPGSGYRTGEVLIYSLPIGAGSEPVTIVEGVSGWYVGGRAGTPLVIDSRGNNSLVVVTDVGGGTFEAEEFYSSSGGYYGSAPDIRINADGCFSVIFGDHDYGDTGALYHLLLGRDGLATATVEEIFIPVPEGMRIKWIGAVNKFSPDGSMFASSGWQRAGGSFPDSGGGMVTYKVND